jgi:single-stranded-DNA-specific exonuclease
MAAGMTLAGEKLAQFQQVFDEEVQRHISREELRGIVYSDGELSGNEFTLEQAEQLRFASPWGQAFPEPVFDGIFEIIGRRIVGEKHLKLQLRHPQLSQPIEGIAFNHTDHDWPLDVRQVQIAYQLDINEFRGNRTLQLMIRHIVPVVD